MIRFDERLRASIGSNLGVHDRRAQPLDGRRHAAVAIVIVNGHASPACGGAEVGDEAVFLLCRRATRMSRHAGQWALPGGRLDDGETPLDAGLRELEEELGLRLDSDSLVGWLDDYATRSGYLITPVVLWGGVDPALTPAPGEVHSVYRVGLQALLDAQPRFVSIPETDRPVLQLPLCDHLIHAPTAAVLFQLRQVALLGRIGERVDEIGEPVFAWS
jgi:8-oxo-dGTP pyrophosphatase MutT (NUDIX family)